MHSYKPTDIYFDSACGDTTKSVTCTLFNINVDSQKLIDYIEPHPRIKWVEELNRDRNFLPSIRNIYQLLCSIQTIPEKHYANRQKIVLST